MSGFEKVMYRHDSQVTPMSLFAVNDWEWFYKSEGIFFWPQLLLATFSLVHVLACFYLLSGRYYLGNGLLSPGRLMGGIQRHARLDRSERKKEAEKAPANLLEYVISSGLKREKSLGNPESDRIEVEAGLQESGSSDNDCGPWCGYSQSVCSFSLSGQIFAATTRPRAGYLAIFK
ncbi:MAG: hypothetical protein NTV55_01485 [Planctomycetota bacterium]|nr:hypothetical protein [Planctomycetota bacterium]